jgi:hypothetical protein
MTSLQMVSLKGIWRCGDWLFLAREVIFDFEWSGIMSIWISGCMRSFRNHSNTSMLCMVDPMSGTGAFSSHLEASSGRTKQCQMVTLSRKSKVMLESRGMSARSILVS